ncbi:unnamed protein product [Closterium sp. Yama58-4]|nr:unnamed protein product [Closterium sp. Yama58-4]
MVLARVRTDSVRRGVARSPSSTVASYRRDAAAPVVLSSGCCSVIVNASRSRRGGSRSGVACRSQLAEGSGSSPSAPDVHVAEQPPGQLEEIRRGLEEVERNRAAELVLLRGELVTVRGELLTTRRELATVNGKLDVLKESLETIKILDEEEDDEEEEDDDEEYVYEEEDEEEGEMVKRLRKGASSYFSAAVQSPAAAQFPAPKHVEFDVEEELRMRQGAYKTVWQRIHATTTLDLKGLPYLSEAILFHVSTMTHLKHIDLDGSTPFSPEGIKHLYMKQLESLELTSHAVTDSCLEGIGAASSLRSLNLKGTSVTDAGLEFLAPLSRLKVLVLPGTITDAGLEHIQSLSALEELDISDSVLTEEGVALL